MVKLSSFLTIIPGISTGLCLDNVMWMVITMEACKFLYEHQKSVAAIVVRNNDFCYLMKRLIACLIIFQTRNSIAIKFAKLCCRCLYSEVERSFHLHSAIDIDVLF